ncbi:MAG TPA: hypothetical protein VKV30_02230 [Candidatus Angelobacter sp.]|nr:hypothetical protein [Candidatus Angelobacter sp.]
MLNQTRLAVQGQFIDCFVENQLTWRTPISSILLIAEYTTNEGPYVDDYFVELWSLEDGSLLNARTSFYAAGRDDTFARIAAELKADLTFGLTGSAEWASRIVWPPELAGHPYFDFRDVKSANLKEKMAQLLLGSAQKYFLAGEVQAFLKQYKRLRDENRNMPE